MSHNTRASTTDLKPGRRGFLLRLSWTGLSLFLAAFLSAVLKFFWPRVSSRPARSVQVGFPDDYRPGQVVYHPGRKLFIVRDDTGFLSLSARCTHLGCMVVWNRDHNMFLCPCHGGKFDAEGRNVEGPPPRPLNLLALRLDDSGLLVVDQDIVLKRRKGTAPRFQPETMSAEPLNPGKK
jgi:cytochrome b6-f complex iron-sulfur subunit